MLAAALAFLPALSMPSWLKRDLLIIAGIITIIGAITAVSLVGKSMIELDKREAVAAALATQKAQFDDEMAKRTAAAVTAALDAQAKGMAALETKDQADDLAWQHFNTNLESLNNDRPVPGKPAPKGVGHGAAAALNRAHADADRLLEHATSTDGRSAP